MKYLIIIIFVICILLLILNTIYIYYSKKYDVSFGKAMSILILKFRFIKESYDIVKIDEETKDINKFVLFFRCLSAYKIIEMEERLQELYCIFKAYKYHRENSNNLDETILVLVYEDDSGIAYQKIDYVMEESAYINGRELEKDIIFLKSYIDDLYRNSMYTDFPETKDLNDYFISLSNEACNYIWQQKQIRE